MNPSKSSISFPKCISINSISPIISNELFVNQGSQSAISASHLQRQQTHVETPLMPLDTCSLSSMKGIETITSYVLQNRSRICLNRTCRSHHLRMCIHFNQRDSSALIVRFGCMVPWLGEQSHTNQSALQYVPLEFTSKCLDIDVHVDANTLVRMKLVHWFTNVQRNLIWLNREMVQIDLRTERDARRHELLVYLPKYVNILMRDTC